MSTHRMEAVFKVAASSTIKSEVWRIVSINSELSQSGLSTDPLPPGLGIGPNVLVPAGKSVSSTFHLSPETVVSEGQRDYIVVD